MKLSELAKKQGVCYKTVWRMWKSGKLNAYQLPTGTIVVDETRPMLSDKDDLGMNNTSGVYGESQQNDNLCSNRINTTPTPAEFLNQIKEYLTKHPEIQQTFINEINKIFDGLQLLGIDIGKRIIEEITKNYPEAQYLISKIKPIESFEESQTIPADLWEEILYAIADYHRRGHNSYRISDYLLHDYNVEISPQAIVKNLPHAYRALRVIEKEREEFEKEELQFTQKKDKVIMGAYQDLLNELKQSRNEIAKLMKQNEIEIAELRKQNETEIMKLKEDLRNMEAEIMKFNDRLRMYVIMGGMFIISLLIGKLL